ncbi:V(D)J recombination-activating protein 1-like [Hydractinia symbiolongicarpus]|uniref:V(D)J recombination-activating protein 1-like n=1 Tax=Hydractinia symbiolongicarpus TaxID=13093 RepID=UPI00254AC380|nr:V(D)J recombination-activating protein 1-like [Hydractinia symbiolongicarpus]
MAATNHENMLAKLCRVCGEFLTKSKGIAKQKMTLEKELELLFVHIQEDVDNIHPKYVCFRCYNTLKNIENRNTTTQLKPKNWSPHTEVCSVCENVQGMKKGGRPSKKKKTGRPSTFKPIWSRKALEEISDKNLNDIIPPVVSHHGLEKNPHYKFCLCMLCGNLLRQPLMVITCEHAFCKECILIYLEGSFQDESECPKCKRDDIITLVNQSNLKPSLHRNHMVNSLQVDCDNKCGEKFTLDKLHELKLHNISCNTSTSSNTSANYSIRDVFLLDESSPVPREIEDATLHVLKHKMKQSTDINNSIEFKSGGPRPYMFTSTPKPVKNSNEVCKRPIEKRNKFLKNQLLFSSGGNESGFSVQTGKLVKSLKENERVEILKRANITTKSITPEEFVAMKADLSIPWSKLKTMSRYG